MANLKKIFQFFQDAPTVTQLLLLGQYERYSWRSVNRSLTEAEEVHDKDYIQYKERDFIYMSANSLPQLSKSTLWQYIHVL